MTNNSVPLQLVACNFERDGQAVLDIFNHAILHTNALYEYKPKTLAEIKLWFESKAKANFPVLGLIDSDSQLLGFGSYGHFRPHAAFLYSVEHSIYIQQDHQGQGLGKMLLRALIDSARNNQFHTMIAGIDSTNNASIALHQQFGFEYAGTIQQVGYKFDRWLDLVFYQLLLSQASPL